MCPLRREGDDWTNAYFVACDDCGVRTREVTWSDVDQIREWNTRPAPVVTLPQCHVEDCSWGGRQRTMEYYDKDELLAALAAAGIATREAP
jgi:glutaredoxin-related protein